MATIASLAVKLGLDPKAFEAGVSKAKRGLDSLVKGTEKLDGVAKAGGMAVLATNAMNLTAALAPAAGALLAMPAALVAVKTSTLVAKVALDGMSDTMGAIAEGDAKKFEESLKKLSPAAQSFAKEAYKMSGPIKSIKSAVQDAAFENLTEPMSKLRGTLPVVKGGMVSVASALGGLAKSAMETASTPMFRGQLGQVFAGTTGIINTLRGAVAPLITSILSLSNAGMPLAQRMAQWVTNGAQAAATFLTSEQGAAKLKNIVQQAGDTLANLGNIAKNIGTAIAAIFSQSNTDGASLLTTIEGLTAKFSEWAQSAKGQEQIGVIFTTLSTTAQSLGAVLPLVMGPLTALAGLIATLPAPAQETVTKFIAFALVAGTIASKLGPVVSGITSVVGAFGKLGPAVSKMVSLGSTAASTATKVAAAAGRMATSMATAAGKFVAQAARMVASMAVTSAKVVAGWVKMGVQSLLHAARVAAAWILAMGPIGWIIIAVVALVALIIANWDKIKEAISKAWEWVKEKTIAIWEGIKSSLSKAWESIKAAAQAVWDGIKNAIKKAVDFVVNLFMNFTLPGLIMKHWEKIKTAAKAAWDWVVDKIKGAVTGIINGITKISEIPGKVKAWFEDLVKGAIKKADELIAWAKGFGGKILSGLGKLANLLLSAGKDLIRGLIDGVKAMAGKAVNAVKGVVGDAVQGAKNLLGIASPSKVFNEIGSQTMEGLIQGAKDKNAAAAAVLLQAANKMAETTKKATGTGGGGARTPPTPSKTYAEIGRMTVAGLVKGLTESESSLKTTAQKLVDAVKKTFSGKMEDGLVLSIKKGTEELKGLIKERERLLDQMKQAYEYAKQITDSARDFAGIGNLTDEQKASPSDVLSGMKERLQAIKDFANNIKALAKRGLNKATLQQIIDAGVEKGGSLAEMMVGASGSEIKAINKAQAAINKTSTQLGKNAADGMFDAGKKAGNGFLTGLKGSLKEIESEITKIARALVNALKKELKIKSPSRVFAGIGMFSMEGLLKGLLSGASVVVNTAKEIAGDIAKASVIPYQPNKSFLDQMPISPAIPLMRPNVGPVGGGFTPDGTPGGNGTVVNVYNHYPQAEPTSKTVNRSLQIAGSMGVL